MGEFDFTYSVPANFNKRVVQFLQQFGKAHVAQAFNGANMSMKILVWLIMQG